MTQRYAEVIGDPIAHSKSPLIHRFWLQALTIDGDYRKTHVTSNGLAGYFADRETDPDWLGCNVTLPHKTAVLNHVGDPGGVRGTIGAVNTVIRGADSALIGTNTDAAGFYAPIAELDLAGRPVAVVGAGGAARAVLFALARCDVGRVTILNRTPASGAALLQQFALAGESVALDAPLPRAALLVNASVLGMIGQPALDIDLTPLPDDCVVYDIVYAPTVTPLLAAAEERGLATVDGFEMLIGQAAVAFELFFGVAPPRGEDERLRALLRL